MFPLPLVVTVGNSRLLRFFLVAIHVCCAAAILLAALSPVARAAGLALLIFSLVYYWRPAPDVRLRGHGDGKLEIWRDQHWQVVRLASTSVIMPGCTVLHIPSGSRWQNSYLVVLPDSLPAEDFRRLRVWLRWRGGKPDTIRTRPGTPIQ
jgi:toxin CptA